MEHRKGGCHCGKVRYEVEVDLTKPVVECNCSICGGKGLLLSFVPTEQMTVLSGEDSLTEYRFNTEKIVHLFCKVCGTETFARGEGPDGKATYAINVRTLDEVDLATLSRMPYDGKAL
ncbi:MAG: Gfa-like protein [Parcubacteria group bacterium]|nr:Gfa-like protein [Parcubacteria group bacterium]